MSCRGYFGGSFYVDAEVGWKNTCLDFHLQGWEVRFLALFLIDDYRLAGFDCDCLRKGRHAFCAAFT